MRKLACSTECHRDILAYDAAITAILTKTSKGNKTTGLFSIAAGVAFVLLGLYHLLFDRIPILIALSLVVGVIFLVAGVFYLRNARMTGSSN
jgi:uncharacterized membrane protein HdeD (DUF308 family)